VIHDLDSTLEKIIFERGRMTKRDVDLSFETPTGEWSARLSRPTINAWAFDIRENVRLRNADMSSAISKTDKGAKITVPPRRIDIAYLITAWARKVEDEHQLLWRTLAALSQSRFITPSTADGLLKEQPYDIPLFVGTTPPEFAVNITELWGVLNNQMRLGFLLIATLALDVGAALEVPLVIEGRLIVGQSLEPESRSLDAADFPPEKPIRIKRKPNETPENGDQGGD